MWVVATITADILIVGGGGAGLRAALAAAEENPELKIALVSKVYPVRSHTVSAEGGIAGVVRDYDSFEKHSFDTIRGSDYLADQDVVEFFVEEAPKEIVQLEHWGCPWSREEDGKMAVRAFGGMSVKRTVYAADKTGFYILHSLFERTLKYPNIIRYDEWYATKVIVENGRARGVVALNLHDGTLNVLESSAVILATGGAGKIYAFTTNGAIKTGDGMALAYEAGAELKDMEFVQFHPTGLPRTGILITEGARGEGGYLLNKNGERFMKDYLPAKMELGPRDIISRAITSEIKAGRGIASPYGDYVHLDLRHLGEKKIDERLPLVREVSIDFMGVDPVHEPIPVRPVLHYFMGGVATTINGETTVPGLYAAGEVACVTINGSNRLGSNSLAECLVFGRTAGEAAAVFAQENPRAEVSPNVLHDEERRIEELKNRSGEEKLAVVRDEMQQIMEAHAGIEREKTELAEGVEKVVALKKRARNIKLSDHSNLFNTELIARLELDNMLTVAEALLRAAHDRDESRGAHTRSDFPERDDTNFLHHTHITKDQEGMHLTKKPVTITKWKPEPRVY